MTAMETAIQEEALQRERERKTLERAMREANIRVRCKRVDTATPQPVACGRGFVSGLHIWSSAVDLLYASCIGAGRRGPPELSRAYSLLLAGVLAPMDGLLLPTRRGG